MTASLATSCQSGATERPCCMRPARVLMARNASNPKTTTPRMLPSVMGQVALSDQDQTLRFQRNRRALGDAQQHATEREEAGQTDNKGRYAQVGNPVAIEEADGDSERDDASHRYPDREVVGVVHDGLRCRRAGRARAPTDRSISPEMMTKTMPEASMPVMGHLAEQV